VVSESPEDVVGFVGVSGHATGPHLHVSFIVADDVGSIYDKTIAVLKQGLNDLSENPFNYEIPYRWAQ
jgi:murein DD-endopeptidase MepM/ murein hydrolase activator NlpD